MNESQKSNPPSPQPPAGSVSEPTADPSLNAELASDESSSTARVQMDAPEVPPKNPTIEDSASAQKPEDSNTAAAAAGALKADAKSIQDPASTRKPTDSSAEPIAAPELIVESEIDASDPGDPSQPDAKAENPQTSPGEMVAPKKKATTSKAKGDKSFLHQVLENKIPIPGKVIGWNKGGFHIVVDGVAAFCPRSEMELGNPREPKSYIDEEFEFLVLKIQEKGRRIIVSRSACLTAKRSEDQKAAVKGLAVGAVLEGTVASITDFGAFVDLNGVQGLVHISELSQRRVEKTEEIVQVGQTVNVKILKLSNDGKRISLSIKALEPNPWKSILERYPGGSLTKGRVERTNRYGAFIELEPGITGLLPTSGMSLPRDTSPARAYPPGKRLSVQILSIDSKKHRISLGLEGSSEEGSRQDYQKFVQKSEDDTSSGFNALASAFAKIQDKTD